MGYIWSLLGGASFCSAHGQALETEEDLCRGPVQSTSLQPPRFSWCRKPAELQTLSSELQQGHPGLGPPGWRGWALFWFCQGLGYFLLLLLLLLLFFFLNHASLGLFVDSFSAGTWVRLEVGIDGRLEESRPSSSPWRLLEEWGEHRHLSVPGWKKPGWGEFCSQTCSSQGRERTQLHPGPPE